MTVAHSRIGLALSGGAARGFAHVPILEAFDSAHVQPSIIAGTSMGAVIGALYAAGRSGQEIRSLVHDTFGNSATVMSQLWANRRQRGRMFWMGWRTPTQFDALGLLEAFLPDDLPPRIEDLQIPFRAVAVDFNSSEEFTFSEGPLVPALAASIAVPGLIRWACAAVCALASVSGRS